MRLVTTRYIYATTESLAWRDFTGRFMHQFSILLIHEQNILWTIRNLVFYVIPVLDHKNDDQILTYAVSIMALKWDIYFPYILFSKEHDE